MLNLANCTTEPGVGWQHNTILMINSAEPGRAKSCEKYGRLTRCTTPIATTWPGSGQYMFNKLQRNKCRIFQYQQHGDTFPRIFLYRNALILFLLFCSTHSALFPVGKLSSLSGNKIANKASECSKGLRMQRWQCECWLHCSVRVIYSCNGRWWRTATMCLEKNSNRNFFK